MRVNTGQFKNYCQKCKPGFIISAIIKITRMSTREYGTYVNSIADPLNVNGSISIITLCTKGNTNLSVKKGYKGFNMQSLLKKHVERCFRGVVP